MRDAHAIRITALIDALRALDSQNIAELPSGPLDLSNDDVQIELNLGKNNLISAAYVVLGDGLADAEVRQNRRQTARSLPVLTLAEVTITATRWVASLVHALGGIAVPEVLADAVVAAATYQLATRYLLGSSDNQRYVSLDGVLADALTKANSVHS